MNLHSTTWYSQEWIYKSRGTPGKFPAKRVEPLLSIRHNKNYLMLVKVDKDYSAAAI